MRYFNLYFAPILNLYFAPILMALALLGFAVPAAAQQMHCGPNNGNIQAQLSDSYGEKIIDQQDVPNGRAELWANDETGSFTILFFPSSQNGKVVCVAGTGTNPGLIDQSKTA